MNVMEKFIRAVFKLIFEIQKVLVRMRLEKKKNMS